jgi:hypothetical protein
MPNIPHVHRRTAMNGKGPHQAGSTVVLILIVFLVIMIVQSFCTYHYVP